MNNRNYQIMGYLMGALLLYYILQLMAPYLILGLIGLIIFQISTHYRRK